jgi:NAD(P)H-hydrate epimerase
MERASMAFVEDYVNLPVGQSPVTVVCGPGNNGGDGLAIARLLHQRNYQVEVWLIKLGAGSSTNNRMNLKHWKEFGGVVEIKEPAQLKGLAPKGVIIDAIFGSGIGRGISGLPAEVIEFINKSRCLVVAVDMPSGLFAEQPNPDGAIIEADHTLSFQVPKLAFFLPQNQTYVGDWHILDIGLDGQFMGQLQVDQFSIDQSLIQGFRRAEHKYAHKGNFGHALLVVGAKGKMGAAVLAANAALRGGLGLLTVHVPVCGYQILQTKVPEAMCQLDDHENKCTDVQVSEGITSIGVGPGLGQARETVRGLKKLLETADSPMVIDADGLNIISQHRECLHLLPNQSILTPHPKEFQRLAGEATDDYQRLQIQKEFASRYGVIVVYKGAHTTVALPDGKLFFNTTGNSGMATAGSGDVLMGLITGLLTRTKDPVLAAVVGVYIHGLAGDLAATAISKPALTAGDIIQQIGPAIKNTNLQL